MAVIEKPAYRCDRCEHEWYPRLQTEELPAICPKCKSAYWNKPRRIDSARNTIEQARESMKLRKKRSSIHDI